MNRLSLFPGQAVLYMDFCYLATHSKTCIHRGMVARQHTVEIMAMDCEVHPGYVAVDEFVPVDLVFQG